MPFLGRIVLVSSSRKTVGSKWLEIIDSHPSLRHVPPVMGINPFNHQPCEYNAPASTAQVLANGVQIGSIEWEQDGSRFLNVILHVEDEQSAMVVVGVAAELAALLSARFVPDER